MNMHSRIVDYQTHSGIYVDCPASLCFLQLRTDEPVLIC